MDDSMSPKQIKQMISMLKQMLPEDDNEEPEKQQPEPIRTVHRKPIQTENKFDQMMEAHLHKEDIAIDQKLKKFDPTPRIRSFDPLKVVCRVCGKKDEINPATLTDSADRYKCNNCARSAG